MKSRCWLMKSEPDTFSIDDLERMGRSSWDGVRSYQARNFMRDEMQVGDKILFYHSNAKPSGIAGIARVVREAYPDHTAWNKKSPYFDPRSIPEAPRWCMVDIAFVKKFPRIVSLEELRHHKALRDMWVLRKGMRLSVQPVAAEHFRLIEALSAKISAREAVVLK
jgi:predicted RNA-binding protein with PUA-like domain